jgi:dTDP-4-dehydrorhamnose 3,5-epimerase
LAARLVRDEEVAGSNPAIPTQINGVGSLVDIDGLHASVREGAWDVRTTTDDGTAIVGDIDGVIAHRLTIHPDHRGRVFEVYSRTLPHFIAPVVHAYVFTIRPSYIKGWGIHLEKDDRYTILTGEVLTVLFDARKASPTYGRTTRFLLGPHGHQQLLIPAGVWHASINLGHDEAFLLNMPTHPYHHEAPDRITLPWDSPAIPVDLHVLLPKQF